MTTSYVVLLTLYQQYVRKDVLPNIKWRSKIGRGKDTLGSDGMEECKDKKKRKSRRNMSL